MNRIRRRSVRSRETDGGRRGLRGRAGAWARLLAAALIFAVLIWRLGARPFLDGLRGVGPGTLLAALAITGVTSVCSAWRWRVVAEALGVGLPLRAATVAYYRSQFPNSTLPGGPLAGHPRGGRHAARRPAAGHPSGGGTRGGRGKSGARCAAGRLGGRRGAGGSGSDRARG